MPHDHDAAHLAAHHHGDSAYGHRASKHGSTALGIAVAITGAYAIVELIGGLLSGSLALLADAGHMATDSAALLFAFAANVVARRPVSERHSFGLARAEVIAAFVNATTARYPELTDSYHWPGSQHGHASDMIMAVLAAAE